MYIIGWVHAGTAPKPRRRFYNPTDVAYILGITAGDPSLGRMRPGHQPGVVINQGSEKYSMSAGLIGSESTLQDLLLGGVPGV